MRASIVVILLAAVPMVSACGDEGSPAPEEDSSVAGAPGAGGSVAPGAGGGVSAAGGGPAPPGQLYCGGRPCRSGGFCAADGGCPAFLGACFTSTQFDTCAGYCAGQGLTCAPKSCSDDGTYIEGGYSWVSYAASAAADCAASGFPDEQSFTDCRSPIWLNPAKAGDDLVRCCCRD